MPPRVRARLVLRQLGRLLAVVVAAGAVGLACGAGLSKLTSDDSAPGEPAATSALAGGLTATETTATATAPVTTPTRPTTATKTAKPARTGALAQLHVTVVSAVLHLATTPSGMSRKRARLGVRIRVRNEGAEPIAPPRPSLLAARQRVPTNSRADGTTTSLGTIDAGQTADITLRFETAGAVTQQLTTQKRARVLVAGTSWPVNVNVGLPVRSLE